ncbi:MAG: hypothetical protein RJB13_1295 [Pseudomonadota bacterium]
MVNRIENLMVTALACGWVSSTGAASTTRSAQADAPSEVQAEVPSEAQTEAPSEAQTEAPSDEQAAAPQSSQETLQSDEDDEGNVSQDIDQRFETEGYVGGYLALLQQTVPTVGFTGSLFVDDDLRFGIDISFGNSEKLFGSFKTRGAALWGAWEISDTTWTKVGFSYSKLERKTTQEPLSVLTKGEDKASKSLEIRNDSMGVDFGIGQLWSASNYSIAVDYLGFTVPVLRLTGVKLPTYSLQFARVSALYNIE